MGGEPNKTRDGPLSGGTLGAKLISTHHGRHDPSSNQGDRAGNAFVGRIYGAAHGVHVYAGRPASNPGFKRWKPRGCYGRCGPERGGGCAGVIPENDGRWETEA